MNKHLNPSLLIIGILTVAMNSRSYADAGTESYALGVFLDEVKERNPEIVAAKKRWEASVGRILPAKTWDNPMVGPNLWRIPSGNAPTPGNARMDMYGIEQKIPFPGKLSAKGEAARHEAMGLRREFEGVERRILSEATEAYFDLWHLREQVGLHREHAKLWSRYSSVSERLYSSGKVTQRDVLLAQVELDKIANEVASLEERLPAAMAHLNALSDRDFARPIGNLAAPRLDASPLKIKDLENKTQTHNPEILAAKHHVSHRRSNLKRARLDYLPDFTAGLARMQESNGFSGYNARIMLSVPLYFWKQKSLVRSAESSLEEMKGHSRWTKNRVGARLLAVYADLKNASRTARLYESSILPRSRSALRVVESGYLARKAGFLDLLDVESRLLLEEMKHLKALSAYGTALAELERTVGLELRNPAVKKEEQR